MSQVVYDAEYERQLLAYFDSLLPEKIYDAHFHISRAYARRTGYEGEPFCQYRDFMEKYLGRPLGGGMMMPQPSSKHTMADVDDEKRLQSGGGGAIRACRRLAGYACLRSGKD